MELVNNLKTIRGSHNMTQEIMARRLGIGRPKYASIEERRVEPNIDLLLRISKEFDITIDDLVKKKIEPKVRFY